MGVNIHPVGTGKAYQSDAVIFSMGYGHTGWGRTADQDRYKVAYNLCHDLA